MADVDTSRGCTTFSSRISVMVPYKETTTDIIIMSNIRQVLYQRLSYATVYVTDLVQIAGQV